jgi:aminoglycoside phosphotransferase (APT) family kinase protein
VEWDVAALSRWMDRAGLPGASEAVSIRTLTGGSQNEVLLLERGGVQCVLRRPPDAASTDRLDTFYRERSLLQALAGSDVPHARLLGWQDDGEVLGAPFYVMEWVDGWSPGPAWPAPFDANLADRPGLGLQLADGIARLATVDWRAAGLEGFGHPEDFHERQVDRWLGFLARYQFRDLPGLATAGEWLRRHRPGHYEPGIMHGDYQFANVMYRHGAPARLAAIIDWEMSTVGDPLLDLGWALIAWGPEGDDMVHLRYVDYEGMPSRADMLEHYATVSGRPVDDIDYYIVLARFKLAIVLEKTVAAHRAGLRGDEVAHFDPIVRELAAKAGALAAGTP